MYTNYVNLQCCRWPSVDCGFRIRRGSLKFECGSHVTLITAQPQPNILLSLVIHLCWLSLTDKTVQKSWHLESCTTSSGETLSLVLIGSCLVKLNLGVLLRQKVLWAIAPLNWQRYWWFQRGKTKWMISWYRIIQSNRTTNPQIKLNNDVEISFFFFPFDSIPHQDMDSDPLLACWLQGQEKPLQMPVLYGNCDIRSVPRCAVCEESMCSQL